MNQYHSFNRNQRTQDNDEPDPDYSMNVKNFWKFTLIFLINNILYKTKIHTIFIKKKKF